LVAGAGFEPPTFGL